MPVRDDYEYVHISGVATTVIAGVATKLIRVNINTTANGVITMYNAATSLTCSTTNTVGAFKASVLEGNQEFGVKLATGLTIVTLAASDITVVYANA